jgi:GDSL-like lipase/acylhydrolase family protein
MRRLLISSSLLATALVLAACGSDSTSAATGTTSGTTGAGGSSAGTTGAGGATAGTTTSGTGGSAPVVPAYKSYVILGDSISDHGGVGPFFYDILATNDDNVYPEWKGKDLKSKFGQDLMVVSTAKGGAVSKDLPGQVTKLPASLPGPVAVTITIGGNDMQVAIGNILQGTDQPDQDAMRANLKAALGELTMPGRFGAGVEVHVFQADIYDPTGGKGDFSKEGCPAPLSFLPVTPTDTFFMNWNGMVKDEVPMHGVSLVEPLHDGFYAHSLSNKADGWFHTDCIHPNKVGHNQLRAMFWTAITGEAAPM